MRPRYPIRHITTWVGFTQSHGAERGLACFRVACKSSCRVACGSWRVELRLAHRLTPAC